MGCFTSVGSDRVPITIHVLTRKSMKLLRMRHLSHQWTMPGDSDKQVVMALTMAEIKFLSNHLISYHNENVDAGQFCPTTEGLLEKLSLDANLELEPR